MSVNIRLPNVTAPTEAGKMAQVQSYMFQLVEQLNYELNNLQKSVSETSAEMIRRTSSSSKEDVSADDAITTFNTIKSLIIKSADIIQAYYDEMKLRFDGSYLAISSYGEYMERYWQELDIDPKSITQMFELIQEIDGTVEGIEDKLMTTNAYIKTGLLTEDPIPTYGVEVYQRTELDGDEVFNKCARFTAGGIYFYVPGYEDPVFELANNELRVASAGIAGPLDLGHYRIDTSRGLAFRWRG